MTSIFRQWSGIATSANVDAYPKHFEENVGQELEGYSGFIGANLIARDLGETIEYTMISHWKSMDAIEDFACANDEHAVVKPDARAALQSFDSLVTHYQVIPSFGPS